MTDYWIFSAVLLCLGAMSVWLTRWRDLADMVAPVGFLRPLGVGGTRVMLLWGGALMLLLGPAGLILALAGVGE